MNHGTATAYKNHGCRCADCTIAGVREVKRWRHRTGSDGHGRLPQPTRIPVAPVQDHIRAMLASGWGYRELARESGVTTSQVSRILRGAQRGIHRDVAARLLALEPLTPVDHDPVVVDRLVAMYPNGTWRDVGGREATIAERHAALQRLDTRAQRAALRRLGYGDQQIDLPSYDDVRKWLGLGTHTLQRLAREAS